MRYTVTIKKSAAKEMEELPHKILPKVTSAIIQLADDPRPQGCKKLKESSDNAWRIRIGDYRVLYAIEDSIQIIDIKKVGHRKDIYQ